MARAGAPRHHVHLQRCTIRLREDALPFQMPVVPQRCREARGQRHAPQTSPFGRIHLPQPIRPLHTQLPFPKVDVGPFECEHLPASQPRFPAE